VVHTTGPLRDLGGSERGHRVVGTVVDIPSCQRVVSATVQGSFVQRAIDEGVVSMAVRTKLAKAVKATLVASAIIAGSALVAPGMASATPGSQESLSVSDVLEPIDAQPVPVPVPVAGTWVCQDSVWANGGGVDFDCAVGAGVTVTAVIDCSNGRSYFQQVTGPGVFSFSLWCGRGAWVVNITVTD
jgi:hypothetical protein